MNNSGSLGYFAVTSDHIENLLAEVYWLIAHSVVQFGRYLGIDDAKIPATFQQNWTIPGANNVIWSLQHDFNLGKKYSMSLI